jgi:hypothetical protein
VQILIHSDLPELVPMPRVMIHQKVLGAESAASGQSEDREDESENDECGRPIASQ